MQSTECVLDLFRRHPLEDIHVHTDDSTSFFVISSSKKCCQSVVKYVISQLSYTGAAIQDTLHKEPTHLKKTFSDTVKIDSADATFAKYLTSPKLFELQLHDVTMRREVYLHYTIIRLQ